ncbi:thiosulfate sulfurtransferase GlpE [Stutzerimonas kirkiae]|uniref:Thiosulfate sulfurtransferase n=1 Tax=Stutzerimonas kirkiae TaxID=2211392 RepID=A0A4Q9REC0_9GAMM|nr:thiosulfate sulfurtransferase GlpE [Stutzerimonas kirkiae]TBU98798.1 thiosulfate sulfurtransferase [Stutzerimonas kirkiae]TBV03892.1 thiosulfate sulfurtransferase [Stutzerimonas kirkiae]TBV09694.1 thiosulfate sulfurtransferase [Stutzerimonas kirkiae]TBV16772.1 thiosulfate sulfurtransferase [Stutzerimonas kirkiae]
MSDFTHLSVEQAEDLLNRQDNVMLLDIRAARDYSQGHDPRAIHLSDLTLGTLLKHTPKQTHLIVCCYQGKASQDMARLFSDFGFSHSYSLDGGYEAWRQAHHQYRAPQRQAERRQAAL